MNRKVWALTKVFLKNSFQNMRNQNKKSLKAKSKVGMAILYLVAFLYIAGIMGFFSFGQISALIAIGQEQVFLGVIFLAIGGLVLFQTVFSSINVMYFSKDVEYVLPLPVKPSELLRAKLNVILVTEYVVELIIGVVPLIIYGILTGGGILYYSMAAILLLVFPILPLVVASLLVMIIMSFAKITKNKDAFQVIATMIVIVVVIGIQFAMKGSSAEVTNEQVAQQLVQANGLVQSIQNYFFTLKPAIEALTSSSVLASLFGLAKVLVMTGISYVAFIMIGQRIYLRGAVGNRAGGKRSTKKINTDKAYRKKGIQSSYVIKELKILFRNPIFFMQCVLPTFLMPVLLICIFIGGISSVPEEEMANLMAAIESFSPFVIVCAVLGVIQFFSMMIYVSATAISRDGLNATFIKYIPVSLYKQFKYKALPNILMTAITIVIVLAVAWYMMKLSILLVASIFIIAILISMIQSYLMEIVDLKRPKLEWDSEYAVVKQNLNLMWPAIFGMVMIMLLVLMGIAFSSISVWIGVIAMILVFGGIAYGIEHYVSENQDKLFEKIM